MTDNIQDKNVGNLGDILKHAALLNLGQWFSALLPQGFYYLDTHAYQMTARPGNGQWWPQARQLQQKYPGYDSYIQLQAPLVDSEQYACSVRLMSEAAPQASLLLSENNPQTRHNLVQQLTAAESLGRSLVMADMSCWQESANVSKIKPGPLMLHLDPFKLDEVTWAKASGAIRGLHQQGAPGLMLAFDYSKTQINSTWPQAPKGWQGPVAHVAQPPFFLAVYASACDVQHVGGILSDLGWFC